MPNCAIILRDHEVALGPPQARAYVVHGHRPARRLDRPSIGSSWNRIPKGPHMKRLLGCLLVVGVGFESGDLLEANLELTGKRSYGKKP